MPILNFVIESAEALPFAAVPTIAFQLRVNTLLSHEAIQSVALRCQIQIEATRRSYGAAEKDGLRDLFGDPDRWGQTLRTLLWTHSNITIPEFSGGILVTVPVACTFDFNVAAAKYFYSLQDGDVPLCFQFSGTIFYPDPDGTLQIAQVGWDKEARFRLSARVWQDMMEHYYPNSAWLRLERDTFERLYAYKRQQSFATWEQALDSLLPAHKKEAAS
jgi:hypothetical protein